MPEKVIGGRKFKGDHVEDRGEGKRTSNVVRHEKRSREDEGIKNLGDAI